MSSSKPAGLYIHVPFCARKCSYCDFYSVPSLALIPAFLRALFREIEMAGEGFDAFDTVYLGGGTPSLLSPAQIEAVLTRIRARFELHPGAETTMEANPGDLKGPSLRDLAALGVNRLSLGVQSFNDRILEFLGRRHSAAQAAAAMDSARAAGFGNIGVDLIYAIPGQSLEDWLDTLARAVQFAPEHLSCYELSLEKSTPLGKKGESGKISLPGEARQHEFFMRTSEFLEDAGYVHYEVSNFARGRRYYSRHNPKYWDHFPYLGLGPSAHSFSGKRRWWNLASVETYIERVSSGKIPIAGNETLSSEQALLETVYLGLRTQKGVSLDDLRKEYGYDLLSEKGSEITRFREAGLIRLDGDRLAPTRAGLAVADSLGLL